jgi:hypothetical protein
MVEYRRRRIDFLKRNPYCQVWLKEHDVTDEEIDGFGSIELNYGFEVKVVMVPRSTEIHHTKKPKCKYLNDESTWLAVCREMHDKIENNKSWARSRGYLHNI